MIKTPKSVEGNESISEMNTVTDSILSKQRVCDNNKIKCKV